jgi:hypothetical protein
MLYFITIINFIGILSVMASSYFLTLPSFPTQMLVILLEFYKLVW